MKNYYYFDSAKATQKSKIYLLIILTALIEVKRRVQIYRSLGLTLLAPGGICTNVDKIVPEGLFTGTIITYLFFKNEIYPFQPHFPTQKFEDLEDYRNFRWGDNPRGNARIKALDQMIKDLTLHLSRRTR